MRILRRIHFSPKDGDWLRVIFQHTQSRGTCLGTPMGLNNSMSYRLYDQVLK